MTYDVTTPLHKQLHKQPTSQVYLREQKLEGHNVETVVDLLLHVAGKWSIPALWSYVTRTWPAPNHIADVIRGIELLMTEHSFLILSIYTHHLEIV